MSQMVSVVLAILVCLSCYAWAKETCGENDVCHTDEVTLLQTPSSQANTVKELLPETHITHQHQHQDTGKKDEPGSYSTSGTVVYYPANYVLPENAKAAGVEPPMQVGSPSNMPAELKELGIDFEGIWWMSDNPVPEELVSFADTVVVTTNGTFPVTLEVPNSRKGMWSWLTTYGGSVLRKYYATGDPEAHTDFVFDSPTEGQITTGLTDVPIVAVDRFPFYKYTPNCDVTSGDKFLCDPTDCAPKGSNWTCAQLMKDYPNDMWSRPTVFKKESWFSDTTYTLKRIVLGDGTKHPVFWDEFKAHMTAHKTECSSWWGGNCKEVSYPGEKEMQSYRSDDWCDRKHDASWLWGRICRR